MLLSGIYERRTVSTTATKSSNAAVFTLVLVLPLMFTSSNGNTQQAATFYICSYNNEKLTGTFSETCNSNKKFLVVPSVDTYLDGRLVANPLRASPLYKR
jgi:hypothetical protein